MVTTSRDDVVSEEEDWYLGEVDGEFDGIDSQTGDADGWHLDEDPHHWTSDSQAREIHSSSSSLPNAPGLNDWKDVAPSSDSGVRVTFDKARRLLWKQAKIEIKHAKKKLSDKKIESTDAIYEYLFGPDSSLCRLLSAELEIAGDDKAATVSRFLATFFAAASMGLTVQQLHSNERYSTEGLLDPPVYQHILNSAARDLGRHEEGVWMKVESLFNDLMHELFIDGFDDNLVVALDDDKAEYNWSRASKTAGLKRAQHVQANRRGFIAHTAATSATMIPLSLAWERENDTNLIVYKRMTTSMFGRRTGGGAPELSSVVFGSDRGYLCKPLVAYLFACGADVEGTWKRDRFFPYTYQKKSDAHEVIPLQGLKDVFQKTTNWKDAKLTATALRNGTGSVSMVMSTIHHGIHWDFCLQSPSEAKWYFDRSCSRRSRLVKAFPTLFVDNGTDDDEVCNESEALSLIVKNVTPRTTSQGCAEWFVDRAFSETSSTNDKAIRVAARRITTQHPAREAFETVLKYAGLMHLLPPRSRNILLTTETSPVFQDPNHLSGAQRGQGMMSLRKQKKVRWNGGFERLMSGKTNSLLRSTLASWTFKCYEVL